MPRQDRNNVLPLSLPPRGLSREESGRYLGIGTTLFDEMVGDGRMPEPKHINGRRVWDRLALDRAFDALPDGNQCDDDWSDVA